jgi:hypothetical protein
MLPSWIALEPGKQDQIIAVALQIAPLEERSHVAHPITKTKGRDQATAQLAEIATIISPAAPRRQRNPRKCQLFAVDRPAAIVCYHIV